MTWTCDINDAPTEYTVVLSSETTEAERVAATLASSEWEYAVPGLRLDVVVGDWCPIYLTARPGATLMGFPADPGLICVRPTWEFNTYRNACVHDVDGESAASTWYRDRDDGSTSGAAIWLYEGTGGRWPFMWHLVLAHEFGHAMHLEHDDDGNVMAPYADRGADDPTDCDVEQWMRAHAAGIGPDGTVL